MTPSGTWLADLRLWGGRPTGERSAPGGRFRENGGVTPLGLRVTGWHHTCAMSDQQPCRPLRAGMFTLVCASVSAHGHRSASGDDVPLGGLLLGMLIVFAIAWTLSQRRQGSVALTAWMLWGQLALHLAYAHSSSPGTVHTAHVAGTGAEGLANSPGWTMLTAHLLAALVSGWWLNQGEKYLFRFLRFMALTVHTLLLVLGFSPALPRLTGQAPPVVDRVDRRPSPYLRYARVLRGPPVRFAA